MSSRLGPIDVCCEAPPYEVVRACEVVGFRTPLDVRWMRVDSLQYIRRMPASFFSLRWWRALFSVPEPPGLTCTCGKPLPPLRSCCFIYSPGTKSRYALSQCSRCLAIYWNEV